MAHGPLTLRHSDCSAVKVGAVPKLIPLRQDSGITDEKGLVHLNGGGHCADIRVSAEDGQQMRVARLRLSDELISDQANSGSRVFVSFFEFGKTEAKVCILHSSNAVRPSANARA